MNILPENLEFQYMKYAKSIVEGHTLTRKEWLKIHYPNYKGEWR